MRILPVLLGLLLAACRTLPPADFPGGFPGGTVIDLTHPFDSTTVYWPTAAGFRITTDFQGLTPGGYYYVAKSFSTAEHGGTHLDAPIHFSEGRQYADEIPLDRLMGHGVVLDVTDACVQNRDYQVTVADFERWEAQHGRLPEDGIVLLRTGFGRYWPDRARYMGTAEQGPEAVAKLHFPGLHPDAARWLLARRRIKAIGLDTPSIDHGQSRGFETHRILFAENIPAFENVANLDRLPATGFLVIALPMKIRGGSGGPLRIVAVLP